MVGHGRKALVDKINVLAVGGAVEIKGRKRD
jgi:hypothetical protein